MAYKEVGEERELPFFLLPLLLYKVLRLDVDCHYYYFTRLFSNWVYIVSRFLDTACRCSRKC